MIHELKTVSPYFEHVALGPKTFEVRRADRPFKVGDELLLREWDGKHYTGRWVDKRVIYVLEGGRFGVEPGYVVLGLGKGEEGYRSIHLRHFMQLVDGILGKAARP